MTMKFPATVAAACVLLAMASLSYAATPITVSCGDTIGPGGAFRLQNDVGPCPGVGPAVRVIGPVRLDLNGHTISCESDLIGRGLQLEEEKARVFDGNVDGCAIGVGLVSEGRHRLTDVNVRAWGNIGIDVPSRQNRIIDCTTSLGASSTAGTAILVTGDLNRLIENVVLGSATAPTARNGNGIDITGDDSRVLRNEVFAVQGSSFRVLGNRNQLDRNVAHGALGGDFAIVDGVLNRLSKNSGVATQAPAFATAGEGNLLTGNTAVGSSDACAIQLSGQNNAAESNDASAQAGGICVEGLSHDLTKNYVAATSGCAYCIEGGFHALFKNDAVDPSPVPGSPTVGYDLDGDRHTIVKNSADDFGATGILIRDTVLGHFFGQNSAKGNNRLAGPGDYDIRDDNPGCGLNRYDRNDADTVNQGCIR